MATIDNKKSCFEQSEADERIQFGVTNSYSDGIVLSSATGKYNYLMNLLIEISQLCNPEIHIAPFMWLKTLMQVLIMTPKTVEIISLLPWTIYRRWFVDTISFW